MARLYGRRETRSRTSRSPRERPSLAIPVTSSAAETPRSAARGGAARAVALGARARQVGEDALLVGARAAVAGARLDHGRHDCLKARVQAPTVPFRSRGDALAWALTPSGGGGG